MGHHNHDTLLRVHAHQPARNTPCASGLVWSRHKVGPGCGSWAWCATWVVQAARIVPQERVQLPHTL
jgi:hypothetical protein